VTVIQIIGVLRSAAFDSILDSLRVPGGSRVFASIRQANLDARLLFSIVQFVSSFMMQVTVYGPEPKAAKYDRRNGGNNYSDIWNVEGHG
jgi:hypothetical protein